MAISRIGSNTGNSIPAGFAAGDLLLYAVQSNIAETTPTGWANVAGSPVLESERTYLFYKVAAGGDSNPTSLGTQRAVLVFRGVDQVAPIRVAATASNPFSDVANATVNGVQAGDWLVLAAGASAVRTATPPAGFTERTEQGGSFRSLWTADTNGAPGAGNYTRGPTWDSATTIRTILVALAAAADPALEDRLRPLTPVAARVPPVVLF